MIPPLHPYWPFPSLHPHLLFEILGYSLGFQAFLALRRREGDVLGNFEQRSSLIVAAVFGAAFGSKLLFLLEDPHLMMSAWRAGDPGPLFTGRSIVGGILGGTYGVELTKKYLGISVRTGDLYVQPLCLGMSLGRWGCFFSGIQDGTHGAPTALPWGMDLGDGILRHPAALYEIVFLSALGLFLRHPEPNGRRYQKFLSAYLIFRFFSEFYKTQPFFLGGLSAIQVACLLGVAMPIYLLIADKSLRGS